MPGTSGEPPARRRGPARPGGAFPAGRGGPSLRRMLFGVSIHQFLTIGFAAVVFILLAKAISPHVPIGAVQEAINRV